MPAASPSQPYILLHMPIWSRPALWNVKKYVSSGWDPHAGTPSLPAALMASMERRSGAFLGLVKRNQINYNWIWSPSTSCSGARGDTR